MAALGWRFPAEEGPDSPYPLLERVLEYPELALQANLRHYNVSWAFVFREDPDGWNRDGRRILGTAQMPRVTGALAGLFDQMLEDVLGFAPSFLIVLSWDWWQVASDREREILVFHELKHCGQAVDKFGVPKFNKQTGDPILGMVAHDLEEFDDVVARYGEWKSDITSFREALERGRDLPNGGRVSMAGLITEALRDLDLETASVEEVRVAVADLGRGGTSHGESQDDVF